MTNPIEILLVEDNPGDVLLVTEAFQEAGILNQMETVHDGAEAVDYLFRRRPFNNARRPQLIILDLNLPRKSGRDVLAEIKSDEELRSIPLVVLTSSDQDRDVLDGYDPRCCLYKVKPSTFQAFVGIAKEIKQFWLKARVA